MRILIGYFMRSGSTLLQHILSQHSQLCAYSDLSSFAVLAGLRMVLLHSPGHLCIKPMDIIYLRQQEKMYRYFNKYLWVVRDPPGKQHKTICLVQAFHPLSAKALHIT